jgi:LmbE family N-acetylglucosaminyl deacetylase
MHWIYLSPHFDDAVLSCGGMIWEQTHKGDTVEIWTVCAGESPSGIPLPETARELHARWGTGDGAVAIRAVEDTEACRRVGAFHRHLNTPDAIYRRNPQKGEPLVQKDADIFQPLPDYEQEHARTLAGEICRMLPEGIRLAAPLAMGGHVDHQFTRVAAEAMGMPLWFFVDYPYVVDRQLKVEDFLPERVVKVEQPVSAAGLEAWVHAISAYGSQLSTFWRNVKEMHTALADYLAKGGGTALWKRD